MPMHRSATSVRRDEFRRPANRADGLRQHPDQGHLVEVAIAGDSGSTPIIWGETIFLNVATGTNTGDLELWAIDRNKPSVMW